MKIGIVISGGDVSGMNNFIFQIAGQADAEITLFNGGILVCWRKIIRISRGAIWLISLLPLCRSLPPDAPVANCSAANMK